MSNRLVVCPYDEAHKVKESRLQLHITKCRKKNKEDEEDKNKDHPTFICPFNTTHVLPKQEKGYHLSRCPDRAVLERMAAAPMNQNNPFKGRTAIPSYSEPIPVDSDEVWDVEENDMTAGYRASEEVPLGAIVHPKGISKPASRRQLYKELHQLPTELDKKSNSSTIQPLVPRQPKQTSEAERNFEEQDANFQHLGLGRGKPPASRIAANIFSEPSEVGNSAPVRGNYSAVCTGMKNLGLGSGATSAPANQSILNDEDFPALGLGRGATKNSKRQDFKVPGSRW